MTKKVGYNVLLIDPNPIIAKQAVSALSSLGLRVAAVRNLEAAIAKIMEDGTIHAVLSEWSIPQSGSDSECVSDRVQGSAIIAAIRQVRSEMTVFFFSDTIVHAPTDQDVQAAGFFYKAERDWCEIVNKVNSAITNFKNRAPFFEALVGYAKQTKDSWHTPGHASGHSVQKSPYAKDFYQFFGQNLFLSDISVSVSRLDSLCHPGGVIKEAQDLAARSFGSQYTFFCTNGTSTANKIVLQTLLKPGDAILLDRNSHKSVHYSVIITGAEPLYLAPSINNFYGIFGPVPTEIILQTMDTAIAAGKRLKVLILTNCTYDGLIYDLPRIVKEAHARKIKVVIDEAWYGFSAFHPEFYPSAMAAGADYATQSTHKTMSAFSQGSMIHVNDPDFKNSHDFFMENLNMHTSTSPQYSMIASLDVARQQMAMEGFSLLSKALRLSDEFRSAMRHLKKIRVLELTDLIADSARTSNVRLDRTKITLDISQLGLSGRTVEYLLQQHYNIQIEKTTHNTISILITIGATVSKLNRLIIALQHIEQHSGNQPETDVTAALFQDVKMDLSPLRFLPRDAYFSDSEQVVLKNAVNRISTAMVVPYPPGIPILVPGQIITPTITGALQTYREFGIEIHGLHSGLIAVLHPKAEAKLIADGCVLGLV